METVVISLGGSVLVQDKINIKILKELRRIVLKTKKRFIIVPGGGKVARNYINAVKEFKKNAEDLDWIGIHTTRLNAQLLRIVFSDVAAKIIVKNPTKRVPFKKVLIGAGWKPGASTDYDAVLLAMTYGAKTVINITNVEQLYDKNPLIYKNAKPIKRIDWNGFMKIIPKKFISGANVPFDIVAAKEAKKLGIKVVMLGPNLKNLEKFLAGKPFLGSVIE